MANKPRPKSNSSKRWLQRQHSDHYVQQARDEGYRSRSAYKLLEINQRDKILTQGKTVVDLGAAPGGWSQVAVKCVGRTGHILAIDILAMEPIKGVDIVQGDIQKVEVLEELVKKLGEKRVDLVISDVAPNLSGIAAVDQARSIELAEMVLVFAESVLIKGGDMLIKVFQGSGSEDYIFNLKKHFLEVVTRAESREVYLLAKGFIPHCNETRGTYLERYA